MIGTLHDLLGNLPTGADLTWPMVAAGATALALAAAVAAGAAWLVRRTIRSVARSVERGRWTGRRVLITVAVVAALGVAGIGGARSFNAVSAKFDSPLVPLVADGMIVACTALRLAALTRGWRIPGALATTYVFIGGTVWLNIDTATRIADALAHALAPVAYAVLVEMLAHMLRLHMKLQQPSKPKLSALTWFTSPVITTRVWLHLARTGSSDPVEARALVQQVVRMSSRLDSICPSRRRRPLDSARAARSAALQTIRDGLLSAGELAALLPASGRLTPGELLALVDAAALGLSSPTNSTLPLQSAPATATAATTAPALVQEPALTGAPAPVSEPHRTGAPEPVHQSHRTAKRTGPSSVQASDDRTDDELVAELHQHSAAEHDGAPMSQRAIRRVTGVGTPRAKRLADLAGWTDPSPTRETGDTPGRGDADRPTETRGQLQLISKPGQLPTEIAEATAGNDDESTTDRELETSSSR